MKQQFASILLGAALLSLGGCATGPGADVFGKFVDAPLTDAEVMPVSVARAARPKVMVMEADDGVDKLAKEAKLGSALTKSVEQLLGGRSLEIVDDALAPKLADALRKAETAGSSAYGGPKVADFVIKPVISNSSYGADYTPPSSYTDKKGRVTNVPGSYSHAAKMAAALRIYEMPSLKLVTTVNIKGSDSMSSPTSGANNATGANMLRAAAENAVSSNNKVDILNVFATKGYIASKRTHEGKSLFQVTLGKQDGLKKGDAVSIFSVRKSAPLFDGTIPPNEEILVVECTVSEMVTDATAWIYPKDETRAAQVRRGDLAREVHKRGFLAQMTHKE